MGKRVSQCKAHVQGRLVKTINKLQTTKMIADKSNNSVGGIIFSHLFYARDFGVRMASHILLLIILSTVFANISFASTRSEMFRTQAVLDLYDAKHELALQKLNLAVEDDPEDFTSVYYRGIVYSRMGNFEKAIEDIGNAMKNGAGFEGLHFELGYAYYLQKDLNQSRSALEKAELTYPDHAPAKYYLGLVYYQQQEFLKGIPLLEKAADLDPTFGASSAYLVGDSYVKTRQLKKAKVVLAKALEDYPDSVYYNSTKTLLESINKEDSGKKPFSLELQLGYAYDDNVGLFPDDQILAPGEKTSDDRFFISADARYKLVNSNGRLVRIGYKLGQSRHSDLSAYDVLSHVLSMDMREKRQSYTWGLRYEYSQADLDGNDFQEAQTLMPNLMLNHGSTNLSLITFQMRDVDYLLPGLGGRSNYKYELLYRYYWLQGANARDKYYVGGRLAQEDAADDEFNSQSWLVEAGTEQKLSVGEFSTYILHSVKDYSDSLSSREDEHTEIVAKYELPFAQNFDVIASALYADNPSTESVYEYDRFVTTLTLRWSL